jgi:hypothetical protein
MRTRARRVRDEWDVIAGLDKQREGYELSLRRLGKPSLSGAQAREAVQGMERVLLAREAQVVRLAPLLADYLESRRLAYSITRWSPREGDLHGPLDPTVLAGARDEVFGRLRDLSGVLERTPRRLLELQRRYFSVLEALRDHEVHGPRGEALELERRELSALERAWERESEQADVRVQVYSHYRDCARRIRAAAPRAVSRRDPDPLRPGVLKRVVLLRTCSLR